MSNEIQLHYEDFIEVFYTLQKMCTDTKECNGCNQERLLCYTLIQDINIASISEVEYNTHYKAYSELLFELKSAVMDLCHTVREQQ
ncbi:MAG: hypothetical protein OCD01_18765 [Fibrobacterales bacterium]